MSKSAIAAPLTNCSGKRSEMGSRGRLHFDDDSTSHSRRPLFCASVWVPRGEIRSKSNDQIVPDAVRLVNWEGTLPHTFRCSWAHAKVQTVATQPLESRIVAQRPSCQGLLTSGGRMV